MSLIEEAEQKVDKQTSAARLARKVKKGQRSSTWKIFATSCSR